jgi:hypothetical protein
MYQQIHPKYLKKVKIGFLQRIVNGLTIFINTAMEGLKLFIRSPIDGLHGFATREREVVDQEKLYEDIAEQVITTSSDPIQHEHRIIDDSSDDEEWRKEHNEEYGPG